MPLKRGYSIQIQQIVVKYGNEVIRDGTPSSTNEAFRERFPDIFLFGNQHVDATPLRSWGTAPHVGDPSRRPQHDYVSRDKAWGKELGRLSSCSSVGSDAGSSL